MEGNNKFRKQESLLEAMRKGKKKKIRKIERKIAEGKVIRLI